MRVVIVLIAALFLAGCSTSHPSHARAIPAGWYDAKPYGSPGCWINGNDTVIACPNGHVLLSPLAVKRVKHGASEVGGVK